MAIDLETVPTKKRELNPEHARMAQYAGDWKGTARTIFEPGAPPIEAQLDLHAATILGGRFLRFEYRSTVQDDPIAGELLVGFEIGDPHWTMAWADSFHTGTAIQLHQGPPVGEGEPISAKGTYFVGPEHPRWGWRIELHAPRDNGFVLRMFNATPEGSEALGVEITLRRG